MADIIRSHLLCEFTKHGYDEERRDRRTGRRLPVYCDPWWWPVDPATKPEHWGLLPEDRDVATKLKSLRPITPVRAYPGFPGSLSSTAGCIFVIGERPSFGEHYNGSGSYVAKLNRRLVRLRSLPELVAFSQGQPAFHITDLIKFRGSRFNDELSQRMIDISLNCLAAEIDFLKPRLILLTCMAEKRLPGPGRRSKLLSSTSLHWWENPKITPIIKVPHWSTNASEHEWEGRVREAILGPPEDGSVAERLACSAAEPVRMRPMEAKYELVHDANRVHPRPETTKAGILKALREIGAPFSHREFHDAVSHAMRYDSASNRFGTPTRFASLDEAVRAWFNEFKNKQKLITPSGT